MKKTEKEKKGEQTFPVKNSLKSLGELYFCFLKIGAVTFGGGYAMLPILQRDLTEKRHWTTTEELMDYFAVGQCTPGCIAINVSTFLGKKRGGVAGAICATLGFLSIPILIILVISACLQNFASLEIVEHAFAGVRVCVCVLILQAVLRLWKNSIVDKTSLGLFIAIFLLAVFSKYLPVSISSPLLVIIAGLFGLFFGKPVRPGSAEDGKEDI